MDLFKNCQIFHNVNKLLLSNKFFLRKEKKRLEGALKLSTTTSCVPEASWVHLLSSSFPLKPPWAGLQVDTRLRHYLDPK